MLPDLREQVWRANLDLVSHGLVVLTWGNVSGIDRRRGVVIIKPSGVSYEHLRPESMVAVDLDGRVVEGELKPSSDTPTHLELYRAFGQIGGIVHTHSTYATMFAQAGLELPCFGTSHADYFRGAVPLTRPMTPAEVGANYEINTGRVIVERFRGLSEMEKPGVLVVHHGPFTWGTDAGKAVETAVALEQAAKTALGVLQLRPGAAPAPDHLVDKHFLRKHGKDAYYGQA